jgi:hypothetical protein
VQITTFASPSSAQASSRSAKLLSASPAIAGAPTDPWALPGGRSGSRKRTRRRRFRRRTPSPAIRQRHSTERASRRLSWLRLLRH